MGSWRLLYDSTFTYIWFFSWERSCHSPISKSFDGFWSPLGWTSHLLLGLPRSYTTCEHLHLSDFIFYYFPFTLATGSSCYFSHMPSSLPPLTLHFVSSHLCRAGLLASFDLSQNCCASEKVALTSLSISPHRPTYILTLFFVFLHCTDTTWKFTI